jgi:hypothetical protein
MKASTLHIQHPEELQGAARRSSKRVCGGPFSVVAAEVTRLSFFRNANCFEKFLSLVTSAATRKFENGNFSGGCLLNFGGRA